MKMLKLKLSGAYRSNNNELVEFSNLTGFIPAIDEELILMAARRRYAPMWLMNDPKYTKRVENVCECFVDDVEEAEGELSFLGKDVRDMTMEELQDLAVYKDIRTIPLYKRASLRQMQAVAYADYAKKELGMDLDWRDEGFMHEFKGKKYEPVIAEGGKKKSKAPVDIDTVLDAAEGKLSLEALKKIADDRGIGYHPAIGQDKLLAKLQGAGVL